MDSSGELLIELYVHGSKEGAYEAGKEAGLTSEALELFKFAGSEVQLSFRVNKDGSAQLFKVDNYHLLDLETRVGDNQFHIFVRRRSWPEGKEIEMRYAEWMQLKQWLKVIFE